MGAAGVMLAALVGCGTHGGGELPGAPGLPAAPDPTPLPLPASATPPAISGGTLLIMQDDATAVAADPDRDAIWLIDLNNQSVRARVRLAAGAEPGRVIADRDGMVHVALRRGGQVVKLDPQSGNILSTRQVCPAPRGMAYDTLTDNLHVACAGGELVTLSAQGGEATRRIYLDSDLRDIVLRGDHLLISRFRSAELLEVDAGGTIVGRVKPRTISPAMAVDAQGKPVTASPTTAWRLAALPTGEAVMLHQQAIDSAVSTKPGGYGNGPCKGSGIVSPGMTVFSGASAGASNIGKGLTVALMPLAVDLAVSRDGKSLALVGPGSSTTSLAGYPAAQFSISDLAPDNTCQFPRTVQTQTSASLEPIAGAFDGQGRLWIQSRQPAQLYPVSGARAIAFTGAEDTTNEGHAIFHAPTKGLIACASCHAEGGDDGHVWNFDPIGPRRTQSLRGGILATAPFHWDGDMTDLNTLMNAVFTGRMSGFLLTPQTIGMVGAWLDSQPVLPRSAPRDPQSAERGKALFNDALVGCASCHSGPHLTNNQSVDVGTGKALQVPTLLGVAARAPYLHTGCAATLRDRFNPACGGDRHGRTSQLSSGQLDDLTAYLETL